MKWWIMTLMVAIMAVMTVYHYYTDALRGWANIKSEPINNDGFTGIDTAIRGDEYAYLLNKTKKLLEKAPEDKE